MRLGAVGQGADDLPVSIPPRGPCLVMSPRTGPRRDGLANSPLRYTPAAWRKSVVGRFR
jgi:hypothetical protein